MFSSLLRSLIAVGCSLAIALIAADVVGENLPTNVVRSGSVTLAWDASPDPSVVGYTVYWGIASGVSESSVASVGLVQTITNLSAGVTYYFVVRARDAEGKESEPSNEVMWSPAPVQRTLGLSAVLKSASDPAGPWREEYYWPTQTIAADDARRFYRIETLISQQ